MTYIPPNPDSGQEFERAVQQQTQLIMDRFLAVLPSNYVAQTNGPWYTLQFQSAAEQLAQFIVTAQSVYQDSDYDFTRPDFLWQILGCLVFPNSQQDGLPQIEGDAEFRTFLKKMVALLLQGATKDANQQGLEALTTADITIIERYIEAQTPGSLYTIADQFIFDVFVDAGNTFPGDPFTFTENAKKVLTALRPAHTLYDLRFLFTEAFSPLFSGTMSWDMDIYHYDDFRKYCGGYKAISGVQGIVLSGRTMFSDPTRSFQNVQINGLLTITAGDNKGAYRIVDILQSPLITDATARPYTTIPTGLSGTATLSSGIITDASQDFSLAQEGEILYFSTGPNANVGLRLGTGLGLNGGPIGYLSGVCTEVQLAPTILKLNVRLLTVASGQAYQVDVDRLGVKVPREVQGESLSEQFYL